MSDKRVRRLCPNCQNLIKSKTELIKCRSCYTMMCRACQISEMCIDCYTVLHIGFEEKVYSESKYEGVV